MTRAAGRLERSAKKAKPPAAGSGKAKRPVVPSPAIKARPAVKAAKPAAARKSSKPAASPAPHKRHRSAEGRGESAGHHHHPLRAPDPVLIDSVPAEDTMLPPAEVAPTDLESQIEAGSAGEALAEPTPVRDAPVEDAPADAVIPVIQSTDATPTALPSDDEAGTAASSPLPEADGTERLLMTPPAQAERPDVAPMDPSALPSLTPQPAHDPLPPVSQDTDGNPPVPPAAPVDESNSPPLQFEVAWEVCWQLGGIYTVLKSKVAAMLQRWDDRYCLIGPYNPATAAVEFEEAPTEGLIRKTLDKLRAQGMACHHGHWLVPGRPRVILLDYRARYGSLDGDKYLLWKDHGIPTHAADGEVNDVVAFGFTVAEFFRLLCESEPGRAVLAHFHEWMGGVAVPRIAHMQLPVATVFTTHATLLGRYLASDDPHFYEHLDHVNPDAEAARYNIYPRFAIERAAAHASTVFTTVSEVTDREAEKLLGRRADVILPNGLNIHRFAALHEFQNYHRQYKERIHEFVMGHFFPSYSFDLDRTLYFFTSGRYEYRNKGFDLFIEAMWRLNQRLRGQPDAPTVVCFIITKAMVRGINVGALQAQAQFDELRETCAEQQMVMGRRLFLAAVNGRIPSHARELIDEDASVKLKRAIHAWRSSRWPSIVTHDLVDDANDPTLKHLRHRHLFNGTDDPVKLIFHPQFVQSTSPLLSLDYDQFVRGCHMGIFPSYYEPWGYTPMEAVALGVPAVTTDLSGFGAYVQRHVPDAVNKGMMVLNRSSCGFDQAADDLADYLLQFCQLNRRQRIELRNRVEAASTLFDWSRLAQHYHDAHDLALERKGAPKPGRLEVRVV